MPGPIIVIVIDDACDGPTFLHFSNLPAAEAVAREDATFTWTTTHLYPVAARVIRERDDYTGDPEYGIFHMAPFAVGYHMDRRVKSARCLCWRDRFVRCRDFSRPLPKACGTFTRCLMDRRAARKNKGNSDE